MRPARQPSSHDMPATDRPPGRIAPVLRPVLERAPYPIVAIDPGGTVVASSRGFDQLIGEPDGGCAGRRADELFRLSTLASADVSWSSEDTGYTEIEIVPATGTPFRAEAVTACIDVDGTPIKLLYLEGTRQSGQPIERTIREQCLTALVDRNPLAMVLLDRQDRVVSANSAFVELFGFAPDEAIGRRLNDLIASNVPSDARRLSDIVQGGGVVHVEGRRRRKDGSLVDVEIHGIPVRVDDRQWGIYAVYQDISARRRAEADRDLLASLVENSPQIIAIGRSEDRRLDYLNPAARAFLGLEGSELPERIEDLFGAEDRERFRNEAVPAIADGVTWSAEVKAANVDETDRDVSVRAFRFAPRQAPEKASLGLVMQDITLRRSLEEQVRRIQRLESLGRLAGGVAHDFNNLLTAITGYSELAHSALAEDAPARADLEKVLEASGRATEIVAQLMAFGRRETLEPHVGDLNGAVKQLQPMLTSVLRSTIRLTLDLAPDPLWIEIDESRLERVLLNVVLNARDALPEGGEVTLETGATDDGRARLRITDNGVGMDEETRHRAFEPFFSTKEVGRGSGLGLASVYGFVSQSGGQVEIESAPGDGTAVTIWLPLVEMPLESGEPSAPEAEESVSAPKILLVDDEVMIRQLARRALARRGYEILVAEDAEAALRISAEYEGTIDLLLTDVQLPGMNGIEMAERLRAERPETRVLFISGYGDQLRAELPRPERVLAKPFSPADLNRTVAETLES